MVPTCIKDLCDFLIKLKQSLSLPPNTKLITMDVSFLYTITAIPEEVEFMREKLIQCPDTTRLPTVFLIERLDICLTVLHLGNSITVTLQPL